MKRWTLPALGALVAVLATIWFFENFERVDGEVWVGPSGAARRDPFLAATRFLERMGYAVAAIDRPRDLDAPPQGAAMILFARRAVVTPERAQALLRWAAAGGHLVIEPEPQRSRDVMLDALRITRTQSGKKKPPPTLGVELPGLERTLQVTPTLQDTLQTGADPPDWVVADAGGVRLASFRRGAGRISVVTGFNRFSNRTIGAHDNAELLLRILELPPAHRSVVLVRPPHAAPVLAWLREHAVETGISALLLLAIWLWRVTPRFGPILPGAERERRQLLEHIRACGRFRWAQGARAALLDAAREICEGRIARLRPRLAVLPLDERCRELAADIGLGADEIAYAFRAVPRAAREFVHMVATLASIHAALSRAPREASLRKRRR